MTIKIMNVSDCLKDIYIGSFAEYLSVSNSLGGVIKEQSTLVNCLFKLEINLMQILQKYKKPIHSQEEDIFLEPIAKQVELIKNYTKDNVENSRYLQFVSDVIDVFCWTKEKELELFIDRYSDKIIAYKNQFRDSSFGIHLSKWLEAWTQTLEEFSEFILSNFKNGLVWQGSEKLPAQAVLGDKQEFRNFDHIALFKEINQGENITRILRHRTDNTEIANSEHEEL